MERDEITEKIIGCAFTVSNTPGAGFLEKVYENSLVHELRKAGLHVDQQHQMQVLYDGVVVGEYTADIVVENMALVELKAVKALDKIHMAQCINYLRATGLHICLLFNFGKPKLEFKRIVL
jgi:GxxExxY protein